MPKKIRLEDAERRFDLAMRDPTLTREARETAALTFFHHAYADERDALEALRTWKADIDALKGGQ